jgi:GH24 family phage-related lysozyme (muramidase)
MNRKPIFDAVRDMLGRAYTQDEVGKLDAAIDAAEGSLPATSTPQKQPSAPAGGRAIGTAGMKLIQTFEGCAKKRSDGTFEAYPDPGSGGDPWTIGWGATGAGIKKGVVWTQQQCDERFTKDMQRYADDVSRALGNAPTTQNQFDALCSFHYNTGAIGKATLTKRHKEGKFAEAANEFAKWNKAGGRVLAGLTRRRTAEAELYRKT